MIKMSLPINFSFTYSIYGTKVMNAVGKVMYFDLTENMDIFDFFFEFGFWEQLYKLFVISLIE